MKNFLLLSTLFLMAAASSAHADVLMLQDFNAVPGGNFLNEELSDGSQLLGTSRNQATSGSDLGFQTFWFDTRSEGTGPSVGGESGDFIGTTASSGGGSPDNDASGHLMSEGLFQSYEFNDVDGRVDLVFDTVDVSGFTGVTLSLDYWINDTGYESEDAFSVSLFDGTNTFALLNIVGNDLESVASLDVENTTWRSLNVDLDSLGLASNNLTLTVSVDNNASAENIFVDNVSFQAVPEPSTYALFGLGSVLLYFIKRRRRQA